MPSPKPKPQLEERILVVTRLPHDAASIAAVLLQAGLTPVTCGNPAQCSRELPAGAGALLLTDRTLESEDLSPILAILEQQPAWSDLPVICLTAPEERRWAGRDAQTLLKRPVTLLERPLRPATLLSGVEAALRARRRQYQMRDLLRELQRANEALRESQEQVRLQAAALEAAPNAISLSKTDSQGTIVWVNQAFTKLTGYPAEEAVGHTHRILNSGRQDKAFYRQLWKTLRRGEVWRGELVNRRKDGTRYHEEMAITPLRDDTGTITHYIVTKQDITERKQAEQQLRRAHEELEQRVRARTAELTRANELLRETNERLKKVLQVETVGVMFWDLTTGCMTDANDTFLKMMGYSRQEVEAGELTWQELTPPEYLEASRAEIRKFQATGRVGPYEKEYLRKDGTRQWLVFAGSSLGQNACVEFCVDIADRKKSEEEVRRLNAELEQRVADRTARVRASEIRFRRLFEAAYDGVLLLDPQTRKITNANPFLAELLGYPREELLGKELWEIGLLQDQEASRLAFTELLSKGEVRYEDLSLQAKTGQHREVEFVSNLYDEDGHPVVQCNIRDITERRRLEEEGAALLARALDARRQLEAANGELNDFASIVSHDLKAPLRGVAALADWLQQDNAAQLDAQGRQRLAQMDRRLARMNRMIEDILQYSRLGRTEVNPEPVPLGRLLPVVVQDLAPPPSAHIHLAPGLPVVQGEPVRLRQLFQNLIGNAIKYADKPTAEIQVSWTDAGSCWQFAVADNGPGIEEEHFERIFKMFQTLAPKDKTDSTGVGLALVKRIVEHAGGRVWVESRLGVGSTFHFTWPKRPQAAMAEQGQRLAA